MLESNRGFTIIQFITAMTVCGLLLVGVVVVVLKSSQQDDQRKANLALVDAMLGQYAENHLGRYPSTKQAVEAGGEFQTQFDALHLLDPKTGKYYVMGADFGACDGDADTVDRGPGYVSYKSPGDHGPYILRICLGKGEYYLGD